MGKENWIVFVAMTAALDLARSAALLVGQFQQELSKW
jgi:hypothetical protein